MVTVWTPQAVAELKKAYKYISQDSPQNAKKVLEEIIALTERLPNSQKCFRQINTKKIMMAPGGFLKSSTIEFHTA